MISPLIDMATGGSFRLVAGRSRDYHAAGRAVLERDDAGVADADRDHEIVRVREIQIRPLGGYEVIEEYIVGTRGIYVVGADDHAVIVDAVEIRISGSWISEQRHFPFRVDKAKLFSGLVVADRDSCVVECGDCVPVGGRPARVAPRQRCECPVLIEESGHGDRVSRRIIVSRQRTGGRVHAAVTEVSGLQARVVWKIYDFRTRLNKFVGLAIVDAADEPVRVGYAVEGRLRHGLAFAVYIDHARIRSAYVVGRSSHDSRTIHSVRKDGEIVALQNGLERVTLRRSGRAASSGRD